MDRRLPRDEDGLAPDRDLADDGRPSGPRGRRSVAPATTCARDRLVERRVFIQAVAADRVGGAPRPGGSNGAVPRAAPRPGGAVLAGGGHDPDRAARASACCASTPSVESLEARPRIGVPAAGDGLGLRERVGLAAASRWPAGRGSSTPRPSSRSIAGRSILVRLGRALARGARRGAPAGAQGTRGTRRTHRPRRATEPPGGGPTAGERDRGDDPADIPFAGLRRNARALARRPGRWSRSFWLVPDLTPPPTGQPPVVSWSTAGSSSCARPREPT